MFSERFCADEVLRTHLLATTHDGLRLNAVAASISYLLDADAHVIYRLGDAVDGDCHRHSRVVTRWRSRISATSTTAPASSSYTRATIAATTYCERNHGEDDEGSDCSVSPSPSVQRNNAHAKGKDNNELDGSYPSCFRRTNCSNLHCAGSRPLVPGLALRGRRRAGARFAI